MAVQVSIQQTTGLNCLIWVLPHLVSIFGDFEWTLANRVATDIVWDGDFSTDWTDPANWIGGVPGATGDVIIPALPSGNYSRVLPSSVTINSMTIRSGGILNGTFKFAAYH